MGSSAERIFRQIDATARELALQQSIPSALHAEAIVEQILRKERTALPDGHTAASLAKALVQATLQAASALPAGRQKIS